MEAVKDAISAVRARRAEMNVPPSRKAKIIIASQTPEIYAGGRDFITRLAYASEVEVGSQAPQDLNGTGDGVHSRCHHVPASGGAGGY